MSAKGIGRLIQVGIAKESVRGTAETAATYWVPWADLTLDEKKEFATDDQSYGIIEDNVNLSETKSYSEGKLQGNVHDKTFGLVLYSMFGGHAVTGAGPYIHAFTVGQSAQHQSLTFFKHDPITGQDYTYANGVVEKLEISADLKKFVSYTASTMAFSGTTASSFTPATTTENRFLPQYMSAKFASSVSGLSSATAIALKSAKLSIDSKATAQDVLGSVRPADFLNQEFSVTGSFEAILQNESDFKTAFMGPTAQAMSLDFLNSDVTIDISSHPEIKFTLAKVTFIDYSTPYKLKDLAYQTVKFTASYSLTDTSMIECDLTNDVATY